MTSTTATDEKQQPSEPENVVSTPTRPSVGNGSSANASAEFEPPLACVRRLLKNTLPVNTNVGKDASTAFTRACGIFIVYLTACANDFARESKRQTITANDILAAIKELDFDELSPQLVKFLEQHRKEEKKKRDRKKSAGDTNKVEDDAGNKEEDEGEPKAKKMKTSEDPADVSRESEEPGSDEDGERKDGTAKMDDTSESAA